MSTPKMNRPNFNTMTRSPLEREFFRLLENLIGPQQSWFWTALEATKDSDFIFLL